MEERGRQREMSRGGGFVGYVVPVLMTSALLVTPGPVIVPHSSLVSEVRAGQCKDSSWVVLSAQRAQSTKCRQVNCRPQAGLWSTDYTFGFGKSL